MSFSQLINVDNPKDHNLLRCSRNKVANMLCVVALLSVFLCSSLAQDTALQARFDNFTQLNANPLYELYWSVDGNVTTFAVRVQTTGWVGFGISETGTMLNSDVIMGLVDGTGAASLTVRVWPLNSLLLPPLRLFCKFSESPLSVQYCFASPLCTAATH